MTVAFDADNTGVWPLHCHLLYHLDTGMFTVVKYEGAMLRSSGSRKRRPRSLRHRTSTV